MADHPTASIPASELAQRRRKLYEQARLAALADQAVQMRQLRRGKIRKTARQGWRAVGEAVDKVNVLRWIDDLERDQAAADELERVNAENAEEDERREICRQAEVACRAAIKEHLRDYLDEFGTNELANYEGWIMELHPDNIHYDKHDTSPVLDPRFYVADADHRVLWNKVVAHDDSSHARFVAPRTMTM